MEMGKLIRQARKNDGLTQKELSQKVGTTFQNVAQWENGLRNPKIGVLRKIANACGVPLSYFIPDLGPIVWPEWIRTAARKPTAEDANEDSCVMSINVNPGDRLTTNWPWNLVNAYPDNFPVWMPLPKKPNLENLEGVKDGL